jgi:hypothetical protein
MLQSVTLILKMMFVVSLWWVTVRVKLFSTCKTVPLTRLNYIPVHQDNFIDRNLPVSFVTTMLH